MFSAILPRGITFMTSCLLLWTMQPFQNRVFSQRKEFAPRGANGEQILSFRFYPYWDGRQK